MANKQYSESKLDQIVRVCLEHKQEANIALMTQVTNRINEIKRLEAIDNELCDFDSLLLEI